MAKKTKKSEEEKFLEELKKYFKKEEIDAIVMYKKNAKLPSLEESLEKLIKLGMLSEESVEKWRNKDVPESPSTAKISERIVPMNPLENQQPFPRELVKQFGEANLITRVADAAKTKGFKEVEPKVFYLNYEEEENIFECYIDFNRGYPCTFVLFVDDEPAEPSRSRALQAVRKMVLDELKVEKQKEEKKEEVKVVKRKEEPSVQPVVVDIHGLGEEEKTEVYLEVAKRDEVMIEKMITGEIVEEHVYLIPAKTERGIVKVPAISASGARELQRRIGNIVFEKPDFIENEKGVICTVRAYNPVIRAMAIGVSGRVSWEITKKDGTKVPRNNPYQTACTIAQRNAILQLIPESEKEKFISEWQTKMRR